MNELVKLLREERRIKQNCDYAIIFKYQEYHLLCHEVYLETIQEYAGRHGITFSTVHTYK